MYVSRSLAIILVCIILVFLVCHFPRLLLNIYEYIYLVRFMEQSIQMEEDNSGWGSLKKTCLPDPTN